MWGVCMNMLYIRYKVECNNGISGVVIDSGDKVFHYLDKASLVGLTDKDFLNAKIASDGKVLAKSGIIPTISFKEAIEVCCNNIEIVLYHGSSGIVGKPVYGLGSP